MIEVSEEIGVVARRVGPGVLAGGQARGVTISRVYPVAIEELWSVCTDPARIRRWFVPVSGDLRVGGRYQVEGNASGTIERCDPPNGFAASWEFGDSQSRIELRLTSAGDGTRLELEHVVPVDEKWAEFGPGAVGIGWDLTLKGLTWYLDAEAGGEPLDALAKVRWMTSAVGREFVALSATSWGQADVAAGADEDQARAAAERTATAYTTPPESAQ